MNSRADSQAVMSSLAKMSGCRSLAGLTQEAMKPLVDAFGATSFICMWRKKAPQKDLFRTLCYINQEDDIVKNYISKYEAIDPVSRHWADVRQMDHTVFRYSDICPGVQRGRISRFGEFLQRASVRHMMVMSFNLGGDSNESVLMALHRDRCGDDFGEDERIMATGAAPVVRQLLRGLRLDESKSQLAQFATSLFGQVPDQPMVLVDRDMNIIDATLSARENRDLAGMLAGSQGLREHVCNALDGSMTASENEPGTGTFPLANQQIRVRPVDAYGQYGLLVLPRADQGKEEFLADRLTPRQCEIAELVARGCRNWQVAKLLGVSENTVVNHLTTIYDKLGIGTRTELAIRWKRKLAS